ncbi:aminodeoxychorismate/anthranilate synthase component II [Anaerolentibacter hominis]|uniref:anthranilate synthase component II n=1 Tax=Anaerolentibacter hominis TaxID=3079009 RepID=UPI0031B85E24
MILFIDNYDSFSYNLVQLAGSIRTDIRVIRNDDMSVEKIGRLQPSHIILSPGPGYPKNAGVCEEVIEKLKGNVPILGVCLGHQAICEVFGGRIERARHLLHGKKSRIRLHGGSKLFGGLPGEIDAARYHSLIARRDTLPNELRVTAEDEDGEVMAVEHVNYPVYGLQFHPESILTPEGREILEAFLKIESPQKGPDRAEEAE